MVHSISPKMINTTMSAAVLNHTRNSTSTESSNSFAAHQREAAESKLYYMRDICDPEQFEALVEEELVRASFKPTISTAEKNIQNFANKLMNKLSKVLCHRVGALNPI
ncbi:hypothetical protein IFR05_004023 [Cadophora sp. M221]|nr:hypothetical protein IFR05_004023 [Cadophora sp. M221]